MRLDLDTARSVDEAEQLGQTQFEIHAGTGIPLTLLTGTVPVPWRDVLLHNVDLGADPEKVTAYGDRPGDVVFELPKDAPTITELVVGPHDEVRVRAGDELWRWDGTGAPVRIGPVYPVIGW